MITEIDRAAGTHATLSRRFAYITATERHTRPQAGESERNRAKRGS